MKKHNFNYKNKNFSARIAKLRAIRSSKDSRNIWLYQSWIYSYIFLYEHTVYCSTLTSLWKEILKILDDTLQNKACAKNEQVKHSFIKISKLTPKNILAGLRSLGIIYTPCFNSHFIFNNLNKIIASYSTIFILKASLFIIDKSKVSETLFIPCKNDLYALFAWLIYLLIIPAFYFNIYIMGINIDTVKLGKLFLIVLFSCADIYILLLLGLNIWFKNMNNIYKSILDLLIIIKNKKTPEFFFTIILSIVLFLFLVVICLWGLNVIILYLGLNSTNLTSYLWLRLTLSPFIFYLFNLFISIYIKFSDLENIELDLSIFSNNMFKTITLFRILFLTSFVCLFYSIKFIYIYSFFTKIINNFNTLYILKDVDLKSVNYIH